MTRKTLALAGFRNSRRRPGDAVSEHDMMWIVLGVVFAVLQLYMTLVNIWMANVSKLLKAIIERTP